MSNIAEISGANVERKIGKASVRDAIIGTGVAIDKMLALTGQAPVGSKSRTFACRPPKSRRKHAVLIARLMRLHACFIRKSH